jgi:hypothetical protein
VVDKRATLAVPMSKSDVSGSALIRVEIQDTGTG